MNLSDLMVTYYIFSKDKFTRREQVQIKVKQKFIFFISSKGAEVDYKISHDITKPHLLDIHKLRILIPFVYTNNHNIPTSSIFLQTVSTLLLLKEKN